ncbi:hypothetical protein ES703_114938 [subsurface metagenome]
MSTTKFRETITTRYGLPEKHIYQQVIDLVKKENLAKSRAQLLLVQRGLHHTNNPEPLIKEKVVYRDREVPVEKIVEKVVYKSPPKVDKPTQEHVAMDDHITDESIGGDHKAGQHLSGDTLMTQDKADPPNKKALEAKKSPEGVSGEEKKGIGGWIALGGFLALIFGPMVYRWVTK